MGQAEMMGEGWKSPHPRKMMEGKAGKSQGKAGKGHTPEK